MRAGVPFLGSQRSFLRKAGLGNFRAGLHGKAGSQGVHKDTLAVYNLRFEDFGKRFDDFVSRSVSTDRFLLALFGTFVGSVYFTSNKIDKQSDKIDKQSADLNAKIDNLVPAMKELLLSMSGEKHAQADAGAVYASSSLQEPLVGKYGKP